MVLCGWSSGLCFFVKQKTAYEMRISDWSSDVCSSDLQAVVDRDQIHQQAGRAGAEAALDQRIDLVGAERGDDGEEADGEEAGGVPHRPLAAQPLGQRERQRSEEHTSELQSLMRISYAVFCLKKKKKQT